MSYVIDPPKQTVAAVSGGGLFPVRRIFCIGRNYADHVREMGGDPKASPPVFFTKPADAVVPDGADIPYAQATSNLHYEGELVVALKRGGKDQARAKDAGAPWDTAKAFDASAPLGEIFPAENAGDLSRARLQTLVNGETRQDAPLAAMIWSVEDIIAALSAQFELKAGDLIFTGTPEGVGALKPGDEVKIAIGALSVSFRIS